MWNVERENTAAAGSLRLRAGSRLSPLKPHRESAALKADCRFAAILIASACVSCFAGTLNAQDLPPANDSKQPSRLALKPGTGDLLRMLGKELEVTGYYYGGSIPMLVDDMECVAINLPLPPGSFVPLVGARRRVKWGDHVRAGDCCASHSGRFPEALRTPAVLQIDREAHLSVVRAAAVRESITGSVRRFPKPESIRRIERLGKPDLTPGNKYAVLFAGGGSVESNHIRYWNDLTVMYDILIASGYQAGDITVIYADGLPRLITTEGKRASDMPVDFLATRGNIHGVRSLQRSWGERHGVIMRTTGGGS